ncbi:charged multivesicular body protein 7 [Culex pipiens pallens]|uniref:charged multivesicular body protein 7 n=1 Tax=Culex pipiens pallens TaxID=42434 RepID=UPI001954E1B2|nr:charged multivesicular body protein 7 [Culex pipiens pallens]
MSRKSVGPNAQPLFVLEESFYPDTWQNDSRMGVLLSEFRVRSINPENYDSKMKFWKEMIRNYCEHKGCGAVSIVELKRVFKRKGTIPYCLQTVFADMLREGQLVGRGDFQRPVQDSWGGWAVDLLVKRPLGWGFGKVKEKIVGGGVDEGAEFVCTEVVMGQSVALEKLIQKESKFNVLLSMEGLKDLVKDSGFTDDGLELVLHHMTCQQRVYTEKLPDEGLDHKRVLLKFAAPGAKAQPITDIERSIYNLEQTEQNLLKMIDKLEQDVSGALLLVKQNIAQGKKQVAKSNLKKKHLLEKNLEKKMNVLDNVQTMLSRIHDTQTDRNVIEAYKIGSNALKNAFANSGITLDTVDDTLAEMKEIMEQQDEMQTMISTPQTDIDDLELEQELSDLIDMKLAENHIAVQPVQPANDVTPVLPSVQQEPKTSPTVSAGPATMAQLNDFDKEIEKRLAALKTDAPVHDLSLLGGTSFVNPEDATVH